MTTEKDMAMTNSPNPASARLPKIHLDKSLVGRRDKALTAGWRAPYRRNRACKAGGPGQEAR